MKKKKNLLSGLGSNKKAQLSTDVGGVLIFVVIAFVIVSVAGGAIFDDIWTDIDADSDISTEDKAPAKDLHDRYYSIIDNIIIIVFVLLWALLLVSSFMVDSHPVFFIIVLILMVFVIIAGISLANSLDDMFTDGDLNTSYEQMTMTKWVIDHFLAVLIFVAVTIMGVMLVKNKLGGYG